MYEPVGGVYSRPVRWSLSSLPVALAVGVAACGASTPHRTADAGSAVFAQSCRACHSLVGNESRHTQGGDLLDYRMSRAALTSFTREMPVRHALSRAQLRAVVDYVLRTQRASR